MDSVYYYQIVFLFVCIVLHQSLPAKGDSFLGPILSPLLVDLCKDVECGKGNCKVSSNSTFGYECVCESGWEQAHIEKDASPNFMPCVVPNCTINLSCSDAPPPAQQNTNQSHTSILDPCHWADCGGGTCNQISLFGHRCDCLEGYYNLLNVTAFPCFKQCALGGDCARLGIPVMNKTVPPPPSSSSSADNSQSHATSIIGGDHNGWLILGAMFISLVTVKL